MTFCYRSLGCLLLFLLGVFFLPTGLLQASEQASRQSAVSVASFDCGKAQTGIEKLICSDSKLAAADLALGERYSQVRRAAADKEAVQRQQMQWLKQVRNQCSSVQCLLQVYEQRLQEFSDGAVGQSAAPSSLFPALYVGGFTGKEQLRFTADGQLFTEEGEAGRYEVDSVSPWPDARYPLLLIQTEDGKRVERHCKVQPDRVRLLCDDGGTLAAEYIRQGVAPAEVLPMAQRCDAEQIYLDVMAAARRARPEWELKGSTHIEEDKPGHCLISLYYLHNGQAIDLSASYDLRSRPLRLQIVPQMKK
ncbi:lysozyme inhibitor LprI family protein [Candidatus Magnetaquicoccus inordinatus]|uniref:lysozyme inhibitor LprI family protein n=1 Tax=Candidatus Magnetaquicoccus inordinatus TaxID=2496818 RepID=UPI00102C4B5F|nr:lysozyme inhibitor LprI family protein [Candidatus Magnetaquicoccus inordinatus]